MLKISPEKRKPPYEEFHVKNYSRVLHYIRNKIGNSMDAEDLTSEIFIYCYNHYEAYDPQKGALTTWLYMVVNNRIKNYYRDHAAFADFETVSQTMQDQNIDLDKGIYLEQLHNALMEAIKRLPERQQKVVMMRYFQNCSSDEIAKELNITPGNVRVLQSRALEKLSPFYNSDWKEFTNHG